MKNNDPIEFYKVSQKRHLNINDLMKDFFSDGFNGQTQMSDFQKTQSLLCNQTRLLDAKEFIDEFQSFEEPTIDSPKVKKTTKRNKKK
jgi:hypothetical protein